MGRNGLSLLGMCQTCLRAFVWEPSLYSPVAPAHDSCTAEFLADESIEAEGPGTRASRLWHVWSLVASEDQVGLQQRVMERSHLGRATNKEHGQH